MDELLKQCRDALELIAETIWQAEAKRALGRRLVGWNDVAEEDKEKYRFTAREVLAALSRPQIRDGAEGCNAMLEKAARVADDDRAAYQLLADDIGQDRDHQDIKFAHLMCVNAATNISAAIRALKAAPPPPSPAEPKEDTSPQPFSGMKPVGMPDSDGNHWKK